MPIRTITGTIMRGRSPYVNSLVKFQLTPGSYTEDAQYVEYSETVVTDANGAFTVGLWTNEEGLTPSSYLCTLPGNDSFEFTLPVGADPITLSTLRSRYNSRTRCVSGSGGTTIYIDSVAQSSASQIILKGSTSQPLSGFRAVIQSSNNQIVYADNTISSHSTRLLGVTTSAFLAGSTASIISIGELVDSSWSWIPDQPFFLSTEGYLIQSKPSTGFLCIVAIAISPTKVFVRPLSPIIR